MHRVPRCPFKIPAFAGMTEGPRGWRKDRGDDGLRSHCEQSEAISRLCDTCRYFRLNGDCLVPPRLAASRSSQSRVNNVIPAQAGILHRVPRCPFKIPAFAGMTGNRVIASAVQPVSGANALAGAKQSPWTCAFTERLLRRGACPRAGGGSSQ